MREPPPPSVAHDPVKLSGRGRPMAASEFWLSNAPSESSELELFAALRAASSSATL